MAKRKTESQSDSGPPTEYTVVARRYRPQQFRELIGQEAVSQSLTNALTGNRVAHAYLFTGARGVGKTSAARILAKALNCEKGPTPTPCDQCDICQGIISGDDVDVIEIDGASNNGVDEIRAIRQNVQFRPARAKHKIYIIDEVHMLSKGAFNALLKTLEEPPPGVKFIFATTEASKVPITIISRCQRFDFGLIRTTRIAEHLATIVKAEKREADSGALDLIARRAAGSMRDAESLLDQILAFGERVNPPLVHRLLGTATADRLVVIADRVFAGDTAEALAQIETALDEGVQSGELLDQLVELWRTLMLTAAGGTASADSAYATNEVVQLVSRSNLDTILAGLDVLTSAKSRMKFSGLGRMLLEMAIVRLSRIDQITNVEKIWSEAQLDGDANANEALAAATSVNEKKKSSNLPQTRR